MESSDDKKSRQNDNAACDGASSLAAVRPSSTSHFSSASSSSSSTTVAISSSQLAPSLSSSSSTHGDLGVAVRDGNGHSCGNEKKNSHNGSVSSSTQSLRKRRKDLFGDCALVEIIHLHDCLRGALQALQRDVTELSRTVIDASSSSSSSCTNRSTNVTTAATLASCTDLKAHDDGDYGDDECDNVESTQSIQDHIVELERRVAGRFKVIWSVFRAHSAAEDEFIWPALLSKQRHGSESSDQQHPDGAGGSKKVEAAVVDEANHDERAGNYISGLEGEGRRERVAEGEETGQRRQGDAGDTLSQDVPLIIEQEEYEEDHADEERMFRHMDGLLNKLRQGLHNQRKRSLSNASALSENNNNSASTSSTVDANRSTGVTASDTPVAGGDKKLITNSLQDQHRLSSSCCGGANSCSAASNTTRPAQSHSTIFTSTSAPTPTSTTTTNHETDENDSVSEMARAINDITSQISQHLMAHLEKEETHCMPLVVQHLTKSEIHDLVGRIMGKRSSDLMSQILTMAVQNLNEVDREEMVRYMKQAMVGTFFERWLHMGGWMADIENNEGSSAGIGSESGCGVKASLLPSSSCRAKSLGEPGDAEQNATKEKKTSPKNRQPEGISSLSSSLMPIPISGCPMLKNPVGGSQKCFLKSENANGVARSTTESGTTICTLCASAGRCLGLGAAASLYQSQPSSERGGKEYQKQSAQAATTTTTSETKAMITSPEELERLIRVIASNRELTPKQKSTTIQGLRDSVWKSNLRQKKRKWDGDGEDEAEEEDMGQVALTTRINAAPASASTATRSRRGTPPSFYYKKNRNGKIELLWSSDSPSAKFPPEELSIPLFSASELAPTYHDGATGAVLGCPHYARACKLRHPSSGRLYTCRLCCEQEREMPMKDQDSPLDRFAVTEVLCMRCGALQPAADKCINTKCESRGKTYAKYICRICNFYDDGPNKAIYHCPFCNVCRTGFGLGIDYRHCMRCNACVSLADDEHRCIPQLLQGNCPICHDTMFESTEPLRGLKCGHVMHLSCFGMYTRGQYYTCPLCKKSVDDMTDHFALLDAAVRMQPMPVAYSSAVSDIYCQDCGKMGKVRYHFVGCKCPHCGSYNTRELGRVDGTAETAHD